MEGRDRDAPAPVNDGDVKRIRAVLDALANGRGALVLVRGPDANEVAGWLGAVTAARGVTTGHGRPAPSPSGDRPFGAWIRALQRAGAAEPDLAGADHDAERLDRAGHAVLATATGPTALVLHDMERADVHSYWLAEHLLDDLAGTPLLLVLAVDAVHAPEPTASLDRAVRHPAVVEVVLRPADHGAILAILRAGLDDPDQLSPTHPLVGLAAGSPAAARVLARRWNDPAGRDSLLEDVASAMRAADPHDVLPALAVIQRPLVEGAPVAPRPALLHRVCAAEPFQIQEVLVAARRAGWVRLDDDDLITFTHPLYARVARDHARATVASQQRLVEVLGQLDESDPGGAVNAERARRGLIIGQVIPDACERAGRWYLEAGEPVAALELLEHALSGGADAANRMALSRMAAHALAFMGEYDDAGHRLAAMIAAARDQGDDEGLIAAAIDLVQVVPTVPDRRRLGLIDEALEVAARTRSPLEPMMMIRAAVALRHHDHERSRRLLDDVRHHPDPAIRTRVLGVQVVHGSQADLAVVEDGVTRLEGYDRTQYGVRRWAAFGRLMMTLVRGTRDDVEQALQEVEDSLVGGPVRELHTYATVARLGLLRFDADTSGMIELASTAGWRLAPPGSHASALLAATHTHWERALGPLPPLPPSARRAVRIDAPGPRQAVEFTALGIAALQNPDLGGALRQRVDATAPDPDAVPRNFRWSGDLVAMAAFAGAAGDVGLAKRAADLLAPHIEEMAVVSPTGIAGPVGLHVAHARIAHGDLAAARTSIEAALRCCTRLRARTWAALAHHVHARIALLEQRHAEAHEALDQAEAACAGLQVPSVRDMIAELRNQVHHQADQVRVDLLSERELEVLRLVAVGATNRQVARDLNISPKTVEYHLGGAFRSLGAANRTEAVELARRSRLL